jgi:hypothetical protein
MESQNMLISQEVRSQTSPAQGSVRGGLAELRRQLAEPSALSDGNRQRLLELARRLARVQSLGDEYVRVGFSDSATDALTKPGAIA